MTLLPALPAGWTWVTFNDVLTFLRNGISKKPDAEPGCGTAILRISSVRAGALDLHDVRYLRDDGHEYDGFAVDGGDILLTRYNGTRELVGVSAVVPEVSSRLLHPDKLIRAKVDQARANPKFVSFAVNTGLSRRFLEERIRTTAGQAGISGGDVRAVPLPLAPRAQQDAIVAEIEKHLTRIDAGVAALERVQANLKRYRASVLKAAVEGRLVPTEAELARKERRDYEPASKLLARILKERRARWEADELAKLKAKGRAPTDDRWKAKYKEPEPPDTSELPELPEGWCWATVEQVGNVSGGVTKNAKRNQLPIELPYLRVANVYADELRLDEVERIHLGDAEVDRVLLQRGDLLVVEGNGSVDQIGRVAIWDASIDPCVHQNHLIKVRLVDQTMGRWVLSWLLCPSGRDMIVRVASSTAGLHTLSLSKVEQFVVPLAPREEQRRALELVDVLVPSAVVLAREANAGLGRAARLRSAVLRAAFEGKLVPPASTDEPPSEPSQQGSRTTSVLVHAGPVRGRTKKRNRETGVDA